MRPISTLAQELRAADRISTRIPLPPLAAAMCLAVAVLRVYHLSQLPANTSDVVRHLIQGLVVLKHGLASAGTSLTAYYPQLWPLPFATEPYHYPVVTLLFFTGIAALSPSVYFAKLALTLVVATNAVMLYKLTRQAWVATLYWCYPASIWWVSREGQFEPLQELFVFAALLTQSRSIIAAFALLALAVQTKLTAVLLLPVLLWRARRQDPSERLRRTLSRALLGMTVGLSPTLIALRYYPSLDWLTAGAPLRYNPYYFKPFAAEMFLWHPPWLVAWNQLASYGLLLALIVLGWRLRRRVEFAGAALFVGLCKVVTQAQFWYLLLLPSFFSVISQSRVRLLLFALLPLLELRSTSELALGPWGYRVDPGFFGSLTVTDLIVLPPTSSS